MYLRGQVNYPHLESAEQNSSEAIRGAAPATNTRLVSCGFLPICDHYFLTASFNDLAAENLGAFVAGILIGLPVLGFTPWRAFR